MSKKFAARKSISLLKSGLFKKLMRNASTTKEAKEQANNKEVAKQRSEKFLMLKRKIQSAGEILTENNKSQPQVIFWSKF